MEKGLRLTKRQNAHRGQRKEKKGRDREERGIRRGCVQATDRGESKPFKKGKGIKVLKTILILGRAGSEERWGNSLQDHHPIGKVDWNLRRGKENSSRERVR